MLKTLRLLGLLLVAICLTGCMTNKANSVPLLPAGSSVALVTGLDNEMTYRYVGSSVYLNNDFQYRTARLTPMTSLILPVKSALEKSGYHVSIIPVTNKTMLTQINLQDGRLTYPQRNHLMHLVKHPVDRIIILTKAMSEDFNYEDNVAYGYGYLQSDGVMYKGTNAFAAVTLRVINMNTPDETFRNKIWAVEQVPNYLFASEPSKVTTRSITEFNKWLTNRFAGYVIDDMRNANLIYTR